MIINNARMFPNISNKEKYFSLILLVGSLARLTLQDLQNIPPIGDLGVGAEEVVALGTPTKGRQPPADVRRGEQDLGWRLVIARSSLRDMDHI